MLDRKSAEIVVLSCILLFLGNATAVSAPSPCNDAARNVIEAIQLYRNAVHDVSMQCTREGGACDTAKTTAGETLNAIDGVHDTMLSTCALTPPPPPPPEPGSGQLIINEVDYDQPTVDTAEFVEILNNTTESMPLEGIAVVFVNGSDNMEYRRVNLSGQLIAGGYAVVAGPDVTPQAGSLAFPFSLGADNIQNGPDAIAIVNTNTGVVLDALSYEGEITNATINGISGTVSLTEGLVDPFLADTDGMPGSLIRYPNGQDTNDAHVDWKFTANLTPGGPNVP